MKQTFPSELWDLVDLRLLKKALQSIVRVDEYDLGVGIRLESQQYFSNIHRSESPKGIGLKNGPYVSAEAYWQGHLRWLNYGLAVILRQNFNCLDGVEHSFNLLFNVCALFGEFV